MWIWFAMPLVVGLVAALIAVLRHDGIESIYIGIVESDLAMGSDRGGLHVRAYVDETLVHELPASSKWIGRMFIRETNTSVPLTFLRVPPYVSPKGELSDQGQERLGVPAVPVIFGFDRVPNFAMHPGQLVDVYIRER
jgi:HlyD family secretion protein